MTTSTADVVLAERRAVHAALHDAACREAATLAREYHWPDAASQLEQGIVPDGFRFEVGRAIVLFRNHWPFGATPEQLDHDYAHSKRLARLRWLLAVITLDRTETKP
jgi:hypothetical protein